MYNSPDCKALEVTFYTLFFWGGGGGGEPSALGSKVMYSVTA